MISFEPEVGSTTSNSIPSPIRTLRSCRPFESGSPSRIGSSASTTAFSLPPEMHQQSGPAAARTTAAKTPKITVCLGRSLPARK
ncbi:MAG TPA: hypothetical protein VMT89_02360 [Candidatus Acidoferrales bacterium]|nr:hypothetical protein [Candidatus Acidoferrales bacterium]